MSVQAGGSPPSGRGPGLRGQPCPAFLNEQSVPIAGSDRSPNETNLQRQQAQSKGGQDQLCSMPWAALLGVGTHASVRASLCETSICPLVILYGSGYRLGTGSPQERQTVALMCKGLPQRGQTPRPASSFIAGEELSWAIAAGETAFSA